MSASSMCQHRQCVSIANVSASPMCQHRQCVGIINVLASSMYRPVALEEIATSLPAVISTEQ
ncbi:MAG: hypothetical protein F6K30_16580 [Cyanothece sp. SIO2G6]|nr:hypothetical protein [Cyanothece sp. SIO2G6]